MLARSVAVLTLSLAALAWLQPSAAPRPSTSDGRPFDVALTRAERALEEGDAISAQQFLERAQERDARSPALWDAWARWARLAGDADEELYARHRQLELLRAQGAERKTLDERFAALVAIDPLAGELLDQRTEFVADLLKLAENYEQDGRRHSAIAVHQEILALDPERSASRVAIEQLAAAPDPSLAEFASPSDPFADVSEEFIEAFDAKHKTWKERAKLERENYVTYTNAGYRVLILASEAMEQMNAFYREFFEYGSAGDKRSVPRIDLRIFKTREGYLEHGEGPPVEWSGGHFTGGAVETYVSGGDPTEMYGILFHEAAHQFVSLATNAAGWLNEGLASFFEGCRILPNGTVLMNEPADHRLAPLAARMERGWMKTWDDGYDPADSSSHPDRAPGFRILVENEYEWGPAWYAPTWGIVFFLYNYQDPFDGRFVYRDAFREFLDASGGRVGKGAVRNFEEVVLANPMPPLPVPARDRDLERPPELPEVALPETVDELDRVWKEWILALSRERRGIDEVERPYFRWARFAVAGSQWLAAKEHFEKALLREPFESPASAEIRLAFAELLHERLDARDRAARLAREALAILESQPAPDQGVLRSAERLLEKADPRAQTLARVREKMLAALFDIVAGYRAAERPKMVMHLAWRFGTELGEPRFFEAYADAARSSGKSLLRWQLAYDEQSLDGWSQSGADTVFEPQGQFVTAGFDEYKPRDFSYRYLTLERLTTGDYSLEAEVVAERGAVTFAGLIFGRKGLKDFHAAIYFPGKEGAPGGTLDLASFYSDDSSKTWKHVPVPYEAASSPTASARPCRVRVDVTGNLCDVWFDDVWQGTQEFASADVLRGSLGLLVGTGRARFQNVRFRASHPRDPSARLERDVRVAEARAAGGAGDGSFLAEVPPFPDVERWVQEPRDGWADRGFRPHVVVFWSCAQNEQLPIDAWLRDVAERYAEAGLQIVSVCSPNDSEAVEAYLAEHPLPGSVAVDRREGEGIGETFTAFGIDRFFLPRVLLLDVDHTVLWEGEPGFGASDPWKPGMRSFITDPLDELIQKRKLVEIVAWQQRWDAAGGRASLVEGRLAGVLELLDEAAEYDRFLSSEAGWAAQQRAELVRVLAQPEATFERVVEAGADPAIPILDAWTDVLAVELSASQNRAAKKFRSARGIKQWSTVLDACERALAKPLTHEVLADVIQTAERFEGLFPTRLVADLRQAEGDLEAQRALLEAAPERPLVWIAAELFGWSAP